MINKKNYIAYLHKFLSLPKGIELPEKFPSPFNNQPHEIAKIAAINFQKQLPIPEAKGKMYGVLVVELEKGKLAYVAAVSGNQESGSESCLVPPIFDVTNEKGFFRKGEAELNELNQKISSLEKSEQYVQAKEDLQKIKAQSIKEIDAFKSKMQAAKKERDEKRSVIIANSSSEEKDKQLALLIKESKTLKSQFAKLKKDWKNTIKEADKNLQKLVNEIEELKKFRKEKSAKLQKQLFESYHLLSTQGETKNLIGIFKNTEHKVPPAAAGDCAAPKLLQFAFSNNLKPIALAEFWWGASPKSEIRKHGYFYPACNLKCKPILGYMLQGLSIEEPTLQVDESLQIELMYEDESLAVIHKPEGLLSVPGKEINESVYSQVREKFPNAEGPLIVHRLDMATSGLMLIAKNKSVHKHLQKQFLNRSVQKRYVALLNGEIPHNEGIIDLPLRVDLNDRPRQLVCFEHGKPAQTKYKLLERTNGITRIHFYPITGRTHQLRMHAAHKLGLNTPIVGDELYGKANKRLHLHAESISFIHPVAQKKISFTRKADF